MIEVQLVDRGAAKALQALAQAVMPFPWDVAAFEACFEAGYESFACMEAKRYLGFVVVAWSAYEGMILNVAVARGHQRQGVGRQLLQTVLAEAKRRHVPSLFLELRASNLPAQRLYTRLGFAVVGSRKGYYPRESGREDAILMEYTCY